MKTDIVRHLLQPKSKYSGPVASKVSTPLFNYTS